MAMEIREHVSTQDDAPTQTSVPGIMHGEKGNARRERENTEPGVVKELDKIFYALSSRERRHEKPHTMGDRNPSRSMAHGEPNGSVFSANSGSDGEQHIDPRGELDVCTALPICGGLCTGPVYGERRCSHVWK